jgi:hypothetical protein
MLEYIDIVHDACTKLKNLAHHQLTMLDVNRAEDTLRLQHEVDDASEALLNDSDF